GLRVHHHPAPAARAATPLDDAEVTGEVGAATGAFAELGGKGFGRGVSLEIRRSWRSAIDRAGGIVGEARNARRRIAGVAARRAGRPAPPRPPLARRGNKETTDDVPAAPRTPRPGGGPHRPPAAPTSRFRSPPAPRASGSMPRARARAAPTPARPNRHARRA